MTSDDLISKAPKIFFDEFPESTGIAIEVDDVKEMLIQFAQYHVLEALRLANKKAKIKKVYTGKVKPGFSAKKLIDTIDASSILKAYSIDNIK